MSYEKYAAKLERSFEEDKKKHKQAAIEDIELQVTSNKELQQLVADYQEGKDGAEDKLRYVLRILVDQCNRYFDKSGITQEELDECLRWSISKANRYDPTKAKAFNFFATVTLGMLRQIYGSKRRKLRDVKISKPYTFTQEAKHSYAKLGINLVK